MKRYMDLIHKILEYAEEHADGGDSTCIPEFEEGCCYTAKDVDYHIKLCQQAGLLTANESNQKHIKGTRKWAVTIVDLTWFGHEVLDEHRSK